MSIFSSIFGKSESFIGVDIGTSSIKIVQIKKEKGAAVLETYGSLAIGPYAQKEIGQMTKPDAAALQTVIQVLMQEAKITSFNAGLSIPFSASLLSIIDIPNVPEERIASLIPYEARKYVPVPIEEVSLDWFVIPETFFEPVDPDPFAPPQANNAAKTKKVLLIAVYNKNLAQYRETTNALKLNVNFFELEIFSVLRATVDVNRYPILVVDIGCATTKFYIIEHGLILRSYFVNQGGETVTKAIQNTLSIPFKEAEAHKREYGLNIQDGQAQEGVRLITDEILSEANRAVSDFESRHRKTIGKIIFTGGGSLLKGLEARAGTSFAAQVEIADPFSRVKHPIFLRSLLSESGAEFSAAVGLALRALHKKR